MPSIASAFSAVTWSNPLVKTGTGGSPARPLSATSTPRVWPHHWRAAASAVKFAVVAPVVNTPPHSAGRPKSSCNHPSETASSWNARGLPSQAPAFWSIRQAYKRRLRRTADHPVKKPRPTRPDMRFRAPFEKSPYRRHGADALLRQRTAETPASIITAPRPPGATDLRQIAASVLQHELERSDRLTRRRQGIRHARGL
jgi:hypothetical protein